MKIIFSCGPNSVSFHDKTAMYSTLHAYMLVEWLLVPFVVRSEIQWLTLRILRSVNLAEFPQVMLDDIKR